MWRKQVACIIAPAIAGGLFSAADDLARLRKPVGRFLNDETGTFDPSFSLGKPSKDPLPILDNEFTPNPATQNAVTAYDYYTQQASLPPDGALQHMRGIDFNQPVNPTTIPPGVALEQYVGPRGPGRYFSLIGATPLQLGIPDRGVPPTLFESVGSVPALQSTTAPDFIYPQGIVPGSGAGGAVQYFTPSNTLLVPIGP
jgi:hypothetical protein